MVVEIYKKEKDAKGKTREVLTGRRIMLGKKEVKLKFTVPIYLQMEEEICTLDELYDLLHSRDRWKKDKLPALIHIMSGGEITPSEVLAEAGDVATLRELIDEIGNVAAGAVRMKEKKYEDDSVHDEVLEELEKKETKAD